MDKSTLLGMDVHAALGAAHKAGEQLRVLTRKHGTGSTQHMRYATPVEPHEICVDVVDNKISRVL